MSKLLMGVGAALEILAVIVLFVCNPTNDVNPMRVHSEATLGAMIGCGMAAAGFAVAGGLSFLGAALVYRTEVPVR